MRLWWFLGFWWPFAKASGERFLISFENGTIVTFDAWSGHEIGRFWSGGALEKQQESSVDVALIGADIDGQHLARLAERDLPDTRCVLSDEGARCGLLYGERRRKIIAVDVLTGQVIWMQPGGQQSAVGGKPALLQYDEYIARLMDVESGVERWKASYAEIKAFGPEEALLENSSHKFPELVWFSNDLRLVAMIDAQHLWSIDFKVHPVNVFAATHSGSWAHIRVTEAKQLNRIAPPPRQLLLGAPQPNPIIHDDRGWLLVVGALLLALLPLLLVRLRRTPPLRSEEQPVVMMVAKERYASEFEELEALGDGGFGTVYRVLNKLDSTEYAVKKIRSGGSVAAMLREVKILASLDHPNIVRYYQAWLEEDEFQSEDIRPTSETSCDSWTLGDEAHFKDDWRDLPELTATPGLVLYIQMQLCSAKTLRDQLEDLAPKTALAPNLTLQIFAQASRGLRYVHDRGLIHRDLKPANIFLNGTVVKLGDFGLSRHSSEQSAKPACAAEADYFTSGLGTRLYAAPEQLKSDNYDQKVDIFSLGVVLYEMLCPKFETQMERYEHLGRLATKQRTFPSGIDEALVDLKRLVVTMLSHSPRDRPDAPTVCATADLGLDRVLVRQLGQNIHGNNFVLRDPDGAVRLYDAQGNALST